MHELTWRNLDLTVLMAADELGLDLDRLVFARYLLLTGRLGDGEPTPGGQATDTVACLAARPDPGIVKRRRKHREPTDLDNRPPDPIW